MGFFVFLPIILTMARTARAESLEYQSLPLEEDSAGTLLKQLMLLALPVFAEHTLHILVGLNDTYLANHIHRYDVATEATRFDEVAAGAAVGTISYILWFVGLIVSAVGSGSTAIIARAIGGKHRRLANSICGQSVTVGLLAGSAMGIVLFTLAGPIADISGLQGRAHDFAHDYLRILAVAMPFSVTMFVANACLRGAGDTLTPAITMVTIDVINMAFSFGFTYGWFGLPKLGFDGIAWGTTIAYISGGVIQFTVLIIGRGGIRLYLHRMRPHWHHLKRLLRIGIPGGIGDLLHWVANFAVVRFVNELGPLSGNAHSITIRIESMSYMVGFAVATAVATMVGQSLGMQRPQRAVRCTNLGYLIAGGFMFFAGLFFIFFGKYPAQFLSEDPAVQELVARCLFRTGFIQTGFAAAMIFGGALRGAGDTFVVMLLLIVNMFVMRMLGVYFVVHVLKMDLAAVWVVLAGELMIRGILMWIRFLHGGWKKIAV